MAIFLLFGFTVAGILSRLMSAASVASHMGGASWWSITKAALLGIPLPLCSCGVIPTGVWLRDHGASRGATSAFLISTPQTGIDSLAITYSFLGPVFALFRPIAALFSGLFGGILVANLAPQKSEPSVPLSSDTSHCPDHQPPPSRADADSCHEPPGESQKSSLKTHIIEALRYGLITIPKEIGLWLFVGVAAAGLIAWLIPERYFEQHFQSNLLSMLLMIALGTPLYICSSASVPVAVVLAMRGLSPGAVFVFLMAGPATNVGAVAILFKVLGVRATIIQTLSVMISALVCGLALDWIYNLIYAGQGLEHFRQIAHGTMAAHVHSPFGLLRIASSILLLLIVLNALRIQWLDRRNKRLSSCHQN